MAFHTFIAREVAKAKAEPVAIFGTFKKGRKVKVSSSFTTEPEKERDYLARVKYMNKVGNIGFLICCGLFMMIFWIVALNEYFRPASEYINAEHV